MDRNDTIRLTRHDPQRSANCLPVLVRDIYEWNIMFATLDRTAVVLVARELSRRVWTDDRDVVPGDFCQRFRQLLQPAIVGKASVVNRRIGAKDELESACGWLLRRLRLLPCPGGIQRDGLLLESGVFNVAIVNRLAPPDFELLRRRRRCRRSRLVTLIALINLIALISLGIRRSGCSLCQPLVVSGLPLRLPETLHNVVWPAIVLIRKQREQLVRRPAFVKGLDQRLHDRHSAVKRTRVAPRFKIMRSGHVPVTQLRRLVFEFAQMDA